MLRIRCALITAMPTPSTNIQTFTIICALTYVIIFNSTTRMNCHQVPIHAIINTSYHKHSIYSICLFVKEERRGGSKHIYRKMDDDTRLQGLSPPKFQLNIVCYHYIPLSPMKCRQNLIIFLFFCVRGFC